MQSTPKCSSNTAFLKMHQAHWGLLWWKRGYICASGSKGIFWRRCFTFWGFFFLRIRAHVEGKIWSSTHLGDSVQLHFILFKLLSEHFQAKLILTGGNLVQDQSQTVCLGIHFGEKRRKTKQIYPEESSESASCSQGDAGFQDQGCFLPQPRQPSTATQRMDENRRNVLKNVSATCRYGTPDVIWSFAQLWSNAGKFAQIANFAGDNLAFGREFEELRPEGEKGQTCHKMGVFSHRGGAEGTRWPHSHKYKCSLKGPRSRLMTGINVGSQKEAGIWASVQAAPPQPHSPSTDSRLRWLSASLSVLRLQQRDKIGLSRALEC